MGMLLSTANIQADIIFDGVGDDIKFLPIDKSVVSESETIKILKFRKSLNGYSTTPS